MEKIYKLESENYGNLGFSLYTTLTKKSYTFIRDYEATLDLSIITERLIKNHGSLSFTTNIRYNDCFSNSTPYTLSEYSYYLNIKIEDIEGESLLKRVTFDNYRLMNVWDDYVTEVKRNIFGKVKLERHTTIGNRLEWKKIRSVYLTTSVSIEENKEYNKTVIKG